FKFEISNLKFFPIRVHSRQSTVGLFQISNLKFEVSRSPLCSFVSSVVSGPQITHLPNFSQSAVSLFSMSRCPDVPISRFPYLATLFDFIFWPAHCTAWTMFW